MKAGIGNAKKEMIEVGMGEIKIAKRPDVLVTRGLGSCLSITLYDPIKKIGAMAHPMLPDIENSKHRSNPNRFVNSVINKMIEDLKKENCLKRRLVAKLFGGAHMFSFLAQSSAFGVGQKNIEMARKVFKEQGIKIITEELEGNSGRTVILDLENGKACVKTIATGEKEV